MITVVNKYKVPNHIYCGRGTPVGNPFPMLNKSDEERNRVCNKYDLWFIEQVAKPKPSPIKKYLDYIIDRASIGDVNLGCFCAPKRCHCDIIKEYVEYRLTTN